MICFLVIETVFDDKLFKFGHFSTYFLRKCAVEFLDFVDEAKKLVFDLAYVFCPRYHSSNLLDYILVFLYRQHIIIFLISPIQNFFQKNNHSARFLRTIQIRRKINTQVMLITTLKNYNPQQMIHFHPKFVASSLAHKLAYLFTVRVRYAPSPTGYMHIGGLRTALFNYLYAKKHNGSFIIRIQDTDKKRQVEGSVQNIFETLKWVGITPDQSILNQGPYGPYVQSERLHIYKNIEKHLLKSGAAFPCFCKDQNKQQSQKQPFPYPGTCRNLTLQQIKSKIKNKEQYAVRIKADFKQIPNTFSDEVFGVLEFKDLDDFIIVRKNGWPTFHFANVIDDWQMKITHVMRGEEWLTNTNKHIYLYSILGAPIPKFVHLPLIKGMNGKKLAKRDPMSSIKFLQQNEYQVMAVKSMLATMGLTNVPETNQTDQQQSKQQLNNKRENNKKYKKEDKQKKQKDSESKPKDKQIHRLLTNEQMISEFDIPKISRVPVKFDKKQLDYMNRLALRAKWRKALQFPEEMDYFIEKLNLLILSSKNYPREYCQKMLGAIADRLQFISDLANFKYYFEEPNYFDEQSQQDLKRIYGDNSRLLAFKAEGEMIYKVEGSEPQLHQKNKKIIHNLRMILEHVIEPSSYNEIEVAKKISQFLVQSPQLKNEDVFHLLRFIITGRKSGPNITQGCGVIGREKIIKRMASFSLQ